MEWQFYWPDWWKLWPKRDKEILYDRDGDFTYSDNYFFFGPLQVHWYSS